MNRLRVFSFFLCVFFLVSCGQSGSGDPDFSLKKDTLNINIGTEPPTLDWSLATDGTSFGVITNIMEGLAEFDDNYEPVPALSSGWKISEDEKTYVFTIRENVFWTDGKHLSSADFLYSWKRLLNPKTGGGYAYFLFDIKNARKFNSGEITDFSKVGIKTPNDRTLVVTLEEPRAYFLSLLTFMSTFPMREDVITKHGTKWTEPANIVTLGPYTLSLWNHHQKIIIERYENYWGEKPKDVKKVKMIMNENPVSVLALYESGELDLLDGRGMPLLEIPRLMKLPDFVSTVVFRNNYVGFNTKKPPFDNLLVRKAFASAIDRKSLAELLQGTGIPITSWIPIEMLSHNAQIGISFSPKRAKKYLRDAGYPDGKGFPRVQFLYPDTGNNRIAAEAFQGMWREHLGVDVELSNQEWTVYLSTLRTDPPPLYRAGWQADFPDPHNFMNLFECGSGNNRTLWCNEQYDLLVKTAARTRNRDKRTTLYNKAQKLLIETDAVIVPYLNSVQQNMVKSYVKGLEPDKMAIPHFDKVRFVNR